MTEDDLVVYFEGEPKLRLNAKLLEKQGIDAEGLEVIKNLHVEKLATLNLMTLSQGSNLKSLAGRLTELEFLLQDAWGFERNINYHRFWLTPQCSCARMDNEMAYPTGCYSRNLSCKVHGND